jgi:hypothetical protein
MKMVGMIFAQCNRRQAANIMLEALGSKTARPSAGGPLPARSEILIPRGVWRSIERNEPQAFKSVIAFNPTGRMGMPEKVATRVVFVSRPAAGAPEPTSSSIARSPSLYNEPILSGRLVRAQRAVCMWVDRQGASPTYRGREFPRHNSQFAQLPRNCAPSLLGHQAVSRTTIGSFRCFRLQNGCGRQSHRRDGC